MTETRVRRGAGWWPSLVLWGTVIAVGSLYLASVEHHRREAQDENRSAAAAVEPLVPAAPAPVSAPGSVEPAKVRGGTGSGGRVIAPAPATVPEVQGPATLGHSASVPAPNAGTESVPLPASASASASASSAAASMAEPQIHPAAAPDAPVTPAEARAFAEAVTEAPLPAPGATPANAPAAGSAPAGAADATGGSSAAAAPAPPSQAPAGPSGAAERARILAEYEAMQRAAQQEAVLRWSRRGMTPPGSGVPPEATGPGPQRPAAGYHPGYPGH